MSDLTFHLEGVIKRREEMLDFQGPLNLILMLLSKNKIEIRDIQISLILEQYIDYITQMQELDLEIASEFVQMASHLVYIKTRTLLAGDEEATELELLMTSLEQLKCKDVYLSIKEIAERFGQATDQGFLMLTKQPEPIKRNAQYEYSHEGVELITAISAMLARGTRTIEPESRPRIVPKRIIYGVREKSRQLIELLRQSGSESLEKLYEICQSRSELVATFVSILELCSIGSIRMSEKGDGIYLSFNGGDVEGIIESISE